jgi:hypothetical protein
MNHVPFTEDRKCMHIELCRIVIFFYFLLLYTTRYSLVNTQTARRKRFYRKSNSITVIVKKKPSVNRVFLRLTDDLDITVIKRCDNVSH